MQRFTLLHDDTAAGWHAAYLAFHVAARLGSPLQVFLANSSQKNLKQQAAQVEISGRAAGVTIETRSVDDFSTETLTQVMTAADGLFTSLRLCPDGKAVSRFSEAFSCPIWVVSREARKHRMAVLAGDGSAGQELILYTSALSHRLRQTLIGLIPAGTPTPNIPDDPAITWVSLPGLSPSAITTILEERGVNLLFFPAVHSSLLGLVPANCVIFPSKTDA